MKTRALFAIAALLISLAVGWKPAQAATIIMFDDLSDRVAVTIEGGPVLAQTGIRETGLPFFQFVPPAGLVEYGQVSFDREGAAQPGLFTVPILEPAGDFNQPWSDLVHLQIAPVPGAVALTRYTIVFESDYTGPPQPIDAIRLPVMTETGNWQDVPFRLATGGPLLPSDVLVQFRSDLGGPEVPAPGTLLLLASGLVPMAFRVLRKRA